MIHRRKEKNIEQSFAKQFYGQHTEDLISNLITV